MLNGGGRRPVCGIDKGFNAKSTKKTKIAKQDFVAFREDVLRRIKLGRLGTVEDLMGAVVFLAGDAAALVTGTSLVVDGGWTAE